MTDFDPARLVSLPPRVVHRELTRKDTILYALGVGAGQSGDPEELPFVYEAGLKALPTMAAVLTYPGFWQREPQYGIDWRRVLHAEQSIEFNAPMPVEGRFRGETRIDWVVDKGASKGALLQSTRRIHDEATGALIATVRQTSFLRGDGGKGGTRQDAPGPHPIPPRDADGQAVLGTRPEQALIYRLSGDDNPLHVDPQVAASAGLPRPILHGLCTYGVAGRAVLRALCGARPERLKRLDCRFSAPVFPGETIRVSYWREGDGRAAFTAHVVERDLLVLNNGYAEFEED